MSIDARITAVQPNADGTADILLEPREGKRGSPAGQSRMTVLNPPAHFDAAVGTCIWGGDGFVMVNDTRWADRIGYTKLKLVAVLLALLFAAAPASGRPQQPTPEPPIAADEIHLPQLPTPIPPPTPVPGTVAVLPADVLYVVTSAKPFFVLASPAGLAVVEYDTGPQTISARFVEDPSKVVKRKFTDHYLAVVRAAGTGRAELLVVPSGVTKETDIIRRLVDCNNGPAPPPPGPAPPSPTDPFTATLQAAYNADGGADRATSLAFLQSAYKGMAANPKAGLTTNATALNWLKAVIEAPGVGLTATQLVGVRRAIAADLSAAFGTDGNAPLDAAKFAAELNKIATALALSGVK